mgnify:CR=1 FL=1
MALQKNVTKECILTTSLPGAGDIGRENIDVPFTNVYIKIVDIQGNKDSINMVLEFKNDKAKYNEHHSFTPDLTGGNFIKQGYDRLKTLPEFADALDV